VTTTNRKGVLVGVLVLISLPVALAAIEAAVYYKVNANNGSIISSGEKREYLLYVPNSYDAGKAAPLVISMHGAGLWPAGQMDNSQWNRVADREGFIVVYPSGTEGSGPRIWRGGTGPRFMSDVRFISELVDTLAAAYNIDATRIYANGLSNGGGMSFALSCTLADRIAAVGMVGAAYLRPFDWCPDPRPVPMISFHGTADSWTPYHGGGSPALPRGGSFPSIPIWTANWARRNKCETNPVDSVVATDVTRREYPNCADKAAVVLYTIRDGGHTWPGGGHMPEWALGPTSHSIDASSEMWAFFRQYQLNRR